MTIKFKVSIGIPGHLDAEDELSNVLQGEGEEEELKRGIKSAVWHWLARWMPRVSFGEIRIRVEQV